MSHLAEQKKLLVSLGLEAHCGLLEDFAAFCAREIAPSAARIDAEREFPGESLKKLAAKGFTALGFSKESGGRGLPYPVALACTEHVAKSCASTALASGIHGAVARGVERFGSPAQKKRFLTGLVSGKKLACFSLSEPEAGSDAGGIQCSALPGKGGYTLSGKKTYATNSGQAEVYLIFARAPEGITAFLTEKVKGMTFGHRFETLGVRGSSTREILFENAKLPEDAMLGKPGEGFDIAKSILNHGRLSIAAQALGIGQAAFEKTLLHVSRRKQFGRPLAEFQESQMKLAEMQSSLAAARALTYHAGALKGRGDEAASEAAQAKLVASEAALRVCDLALQLHGGRGYTEEGEVHRHWRDARLMTIGEGTSEILRLVIAKFALKEAQHDQG